MLRETWTNLDVWPGVSFFLYDLLSVFSQPLFDLIDQTFEPSVEWSELAFNRLLGFEARAQIRNFNSDFLSKFFWSWLEDLRAGILNCHQPPIVIIISREYLRGKSHCTIDLLFDWFGLVCFANKNKNCQLSYSWFQTSQTGGQWYNDTSPFSIPWLSVKLTVSLLFENGTAHFFNLTLIKEGATDKVWLLTC